MKTIDKVILRNINFWQIAGYSAATLIGLSIVVIALQFYIDVSSSLSDKESVGIQLLGKRNLVISKPVGLRNTLSGRAPSFSQTEIDEIRQQPWVSDVHAFRAADFNVSAGIEIGGKSISTALFFESVPDKLIDIQSSDWTFDPNRPEIPIIISKDYLTLYNFGFAASGRMPAISESMLSSIPLTVIISGRGQSASLPARIVGFSSQLNTIAVPDDFMTWAHEHFGNPGVPGLPSRLIIETADPSDPGIDKFIDSKSYDVAGPDDNIGQASRFLMILTTVLIALGAFITLLAIAILILSIYLLVQKNQRDIRILLMLGFPVGKISSRYSILCLIINSIIFVLSAIVLLAVRHLWQTPLAEIDFVAASPTVPIAAALLIMIAVSCFNLIIVRRLISNLNRCKKSKN